MTSRTNTPTWKPANSACVSLAALVGLGVVAISACGSDDAPTKAAYVEDANAICVDVNVERERVAAATFSSTTEPPSVEEMQAFAAAFAPIFRDKLDELRDLTAPRGDEQAVKDLTDAAAKLADGIEQLATDPELARRMLETDTDVPGSEEADRLAAEYGLTKCADGSTQ